MQELQVRRMSIEELKERMNAEKPFILADARDVDSYDSSHIPGAIPVPMDEVDQLAEGYDRDIDVITYCSSYECTASTAAANAFLKKGFRNVWDYKGGLQEWQEQGNPLESNK